MEKPSSKLLGLLVVGMLTAASAPVRAGSLPAGTPEKTRVVRTEVGKTIAIPRGFELHQTKLFGLVGRPKKGSGYHAEFLFEQSNYKIYRLTGTGTFRMRPVDSKAFFGGWVGDKILVKKAPKPNPHVLQ